MVRKVAVLVLTGLFAVLTASPANRRPAARASWATKGSPATKVAQAASLDRRPGYSATGSTGSPGRLSPRP